MRVRFFPAVVFPIVLIASLHGCVKGEGPSSPTELERAPDSAPPGLPAASCVFAVSVTSLTLNSDGDTATVSIDTSPTCAWTVTASESWVSIQPNSGQGPAAVRLAAAPNPTPAPRSVTLQLAEHRATVTQLAANCGFDVTPSAESLSPVAARGGQFELTIDTGRPTCEWTAASDVPWLTLTPNRGTGGRTATLVVAPNESSQRRGTIAVAGRAIPVTQAPGECDVAVTATSQSVPNPGGTVTIRVNTQDGCRWQAEGQADWLALSLTSGSGSSEIRGTAAANPNEASRTATFRIGSQTVEIFQPGCVFTVSPQATPQTVANPGGTVSFRIDTESACRWQAEEQADWLTLSATSGAGSSDVRATAAANPNETSRTASLRIASQTRSIFQPGCTFTVTPQGTQTVPNTGGSPTFRIDTEPACLWQVEGQSTWVVLGPTSGAGSSDIEGEAVPNPNDTSRTATFRIASQTRSIFQPGCTLTATPSTAVNNLPPAASSFTIEVTTTCSWTVTGAPFWLTFKPATGTGSMSIAVAVGPNTGGGRAATIRIGSQELTIGQQAGGPIIN